MCQELPRPLRHMTHYPSLDNLAIANLIDKKCLIENALHKQAIACCRWYFQAETSNRNRLFYNLEIRLFC